MMLLQKPFWPAWACLLVITVLSTLPTMPVPASFNLLSIDKFGHLLAYAALAWLLLRAVHRSGKPYLAGAVAFAILYGTLMEFVQRTFVPGRFFELDDMLANALGAVTAGIGWKVTHRNPE